jgi:hypothetical protein
MRCPACSADNPGGAAACSACGEKLRRPRKRGQAQHDPLSVRHWPDNAPAVASYQWAMFGLIPVLGLVAGPVACRLGARGWALAKAEPNQEGIGHALVGMVLGALEFVTNVAGLACIWIGLRSLGD